MSVDSRNLISLQGAGAAVLLPVEFRHGSHSSAEEPLGISERSPYGAQVPKVSAQQTVVNLVTGGLGTGILSLPWAMAGASMTVGVVAIVSVVAVNVWTIIILVEAAEKYQVFDLANVLRMLPGKLGPIKIGDAMQAFSNAAVWVSMLLCLIGYIIAICDFAEPLVQNTWLETRVWRALIATLLVLPICFVDLRFLSFTSTAALLVTLYLLGLMLAEFLQKQSAKTLPGICLLGFDTGAVTMMSTMMQCVIIQMCVLPMYQELEGRSPAKFRWVLVTAFSILGALFVLFSIVAYATYGGPVKSNAVLDLPDNIFATALRVGMIMVVAAVYPLMLIPMIAPIRALEAERFAFRGREVEGAGVTCKKIVVNVTILVVLAASFLAAVQIKDLGFVNVMNGSLCVGVFTSLCPALVGLFLLDKSSWIWRTAMVVLLIIGFTFSILGFIFQDNSWKNMPSHCMLGQLKKMT